MKTTEWNSKQTWYCYQLSTGIQIISNGKFTFNEKGHSQEKHFGKVNGNYADNIQFNSSDVVLSWEE